MADINVGFLGSEFMMELIVTGNSETPQKNLLGLKLLFFNFYNKKMFLFRF